MGESFKKHEQNSLIVTYQQGTSQKVRGQANSLPGPLLRRTKKKESSLFWPARKNTTKYFRIFSHIKIRGFYGHRTLDLRRVFDFWLSCQRSCDRLTFFTYLKLAFHFSGTNQKIDSLFVFLFSSTMDQGGSSLGLEPFVRCPVDKLLSMNSVRAF